MEFKMMKQRMIDHFNASLGSEYLFEVELDKDELWNLYLDSFPEGTNPMFRERREHDCSCCRHFIKNTGPTVFIDEYLNLHTIFEFDTQSTTYQPVMDALDTFVKSKAIADIYLSDTRTIGTDKNYERCADGKVFTWEHFFLTLPDRCIEKRDLIATKKGRIRDRRNVFNRSLKEISMDAVDIVLELINSNTLYKGEEWKHALTKFKAYKEIYDALPDEKKPLYTWRESMLAGDVISKIRNHSIGVLLVDISEGMDLDAAVRRYEKIVAPTNYKRPKAIFTKKMLEDAKKTIAELGYMDSLPRRFATLDDITVNNILFSNRDAAKRISGDIFDELMGEVNVDAKKFSRVEEVPAEKFVTDILPSAKSVEVLLENRHAQNMVSLVAPVNKDAKSMFKWGNGYSWAYTGNITDSDIRENVKNAGGAVDGDLRFSIQWNEDGTDNCDLDAHCREASGFELYFGRGRKPGFSPTRGQLDVDIINPCGKVAVENITWASRKTMREGTYLFYVHQYSGSTRRGFRAEIEFDGTIYAFDYSKPLRSGQVVGVAEVHLDKNGNFTIKELLPSNVSSREVWGLKTNSFVPVTVAMYSPNYWDGQNGIGHRHYFFMLNGCVNPEQPNGFYNEFLDNQLDQHKRVFEALGSKLAVASADDQLSGLGFSATKRNDVIVKVKGATERVFKIKF
jgi:hypothetical protein